MSHERTGETREVGLNEVLLMLKCKMYMTLTNTRLMYNTR